MEIENNENTASQEGSGTPSPNNQDSNQTSKPKREPYKVSFHGSYMAYLGLALYNLLLTIITLGIYYPWAKCAIRKFLWQETEIAGSRFEWHGTGMEMFKGFIKAYLFFGTLLIIINFGPMFLPPEMLVWCILASYILILAFIPLVIHGMLRYRLSRTSLRGIHFGYRGDLGEFYKKTSLDFLFTIISFGIYGSWLQVNMRKYIMKHSRYGSVSGKFKAEGGDLFWLAIVQGLLIMITFYIYLPWAIVRFFRFYIENTRVVQNGTAYRLSTTATGGGYFIVLIKGVLLTVVTLGIAGPVAELMIQRYWLESISLSGGFDFDAVEQTEEAYTDATGDDAGDILDFDF